MTHHHYDHSGGIRAYLAQGSRVIAHERNLAFIRRIGSAPKTVAPDALSRSPRTAATVGVRDSLTLGDGPTRVVLYTLASTHAEALLGAWIPSAGILFTSDVLSPVLNQPLSRFGSREMVAFARSVGLAPARFVGGHGVVVDWSAVEAAAR